MLLWYDDVSIVGEGNKVEDGPIMKRRKGNVTRRRGAKCQAKLDSSYYLFVCLFVLGDEMRWICFCVQLTSSSISFWDFGSRAVKF